MALEWFKVDVNFTSHPKLVRLAGLLPDATGIIIRLWSWTARYAPTGCVTSSVTRALDEELSRGVSDADGDPIPAGAVLDYVIETGWVERDCNGDLTVHDWAEMQPDHVDSQEKKRELTRRRVAAFRARNASVRVTGALRNASVTPLEEKRGEEKRGEEVRALQTAPTSPTIAELSADWPPDKLALCRNAIASTRASGNISDGPWRAFLLSASQFALPVRLRALDAYLDGAHASAKKNERYLLGIMRGENTPAAQQPLIARTGPPKHFGLPRVPGPADWERARLADEEKKRSEGSGNA